MLDRSRQLIVKIKSLADEARTIRAEEDRALGRRPSQEVVQMNETAKAYAGPVQRFAWERTGRKPDVSLYRDLRAHRRGIVRRVARAALLALAMIRGTPYSRVEPGCASPPDWAEVRKVAERFGVVRDYGLEPVYDKAGEAAWAARKAEQATRFDAWLAEASGEKSAPALLLPAGTVATVQA